METPSFAPVLGQTYEVRDVRGGNFPGIFRGLAEYVEVDAQDEFYPTEVPPLLVFEIAYPSYPPSPGPLGPYRYAGAYLRPTLDFQKQEVHFILEAEYFGDTIADLEKYEAEGRYCWRLVP